MDLQFNLYPFLVVILNIRSWTIILMIVWMEWNIELVKSVPYEGSTCAGRKSEEKS